MFDKFTSIQADQPNEQGLVKVTRNSIFTNKMNSMELPVTHEQLKRYYTAEKRELVQDVFPHLTAEQREFLISGATPEEWESIFGKGEE